MANAVFLCGVGVSARDMIYALKREISQRQAAYYVLLSQESSYCGPGERLQDYYELQWLEPSASDVTDHFDDLPDISDHSNALYVSYLLQEGERDTLIFNKIKDLFLPGHQQKQKVDGLAIYIIVDLNDPVCIVSPRLLSTLIEMQRQLWSQQQNTSIQMLLLNSASGETLPRHIINELLAARSQFQRLYFIDKALAPGSTIEEDTSPAGHLSEDDEEELVQRREEAARRWLAVVAWLSRVVQEKHEPPTPKDGIDLVGFDALEIPYHLFNRLLAHRLTKWLLDRILTTTSSPNTTIRTSDPAFVEPVLTTDWGSILPEGELVSMHDGTGVHRTRRVIELLPRAEDGLTVNLYDRDSVISMIEHRIELNQVPRLAEWKQQVQMNAHQIIQQRSAAIDMHKWVLLLQESLSGAQQTNISWQEKLLHHEQEAESEANRLTSLVSQGRSSEPLLLEFNILAVIKPMLFHVVAAILFAIVLFISMAIGNRVNVANRFINILLLLIPFAILVLVKLLVYIIQTLVTLIGHVIQRSRSSSSRGWVPPFPHFEWGIPPILFGAAPLSLYIYLAHDVPVFPERLTFYRELFWLSVALAFGLEVFRALWAKIRYYDAFVLFPSSDLTGSLVAIKQHVYQMLRNNRFSLSFFRAVWLVVAGVFLGLTMGHIIDRSGWSVLSTLSFEWSQNQLPSNALLENIPLWWFGYGALTVIFALKYVADVIFSAQFLSQRGMSWPREKGHWYRYLAGLFVFVLIAVLVTFYTLDRLQLQLSTPFLNQTQLLTPIVYKTYIGLAIYAMLRYVWETIVDHERAEALLIRWILKQEEIARLELLAEANVQAFEVYDSVLDYLVAINQWMQDQEDVLREIAQDLTDQTQIIEEYIQKQEKSGVPRFIPMQTTAEEVFDDIELAERFEPHMLDYRDKLQAALENQQVNILNDALMTWIESIADERFWRNQEAISFLEENGVINIEVLNHYRDFFRENPQPFWKPGVISLLRQDYPFKIYVGLSPQALNDANLIEHIGRVVPLTNLQRTPTTFEETRWSISVAFYQIAIPFDRLTNP